MRQILHFAAVAITVKFVFDKYKEIIRARS